MNTKYKLYIAAAIGVVVVLLAFTAVSTVRLHRLETAVENAKRVAGDKENDAKLADQRSAEYKAKIDYLENKISEIQTISRRKDDEIQRLTANTHGARVR